MIRIGLSPNLLDLGGITLAWHGLFTAASVFLAFYLIDRWGKQAGLREGIVSSVAPWAILGGMVGARLVHVLDYWSFYSTHPGQILAVWSGGIAIYGAISGGAVAGAVYAALRGFPVRQLLDISAPALILAQAVGRIGDLINGEHFSTPSNLPWAVAYSNPASPGFGRGPSHPAVGYEMLADLALFGLLWSLRGRLRPEGSLFAVYALLYSLIRAPLSFLRLDSNSSAFGLNQQAWLSLLVFIGASLVIMYLRPKFGKAAPTVVQDAISPPIPT